MSKLNKTVQDWIGKAINSKSFSWSAPLSIILVGLGVILAVRQNPPTAIILVGAITIVIAIYVYVIAYIARNRLSRSAIFDEFPKPEYITLTSDLTWIIEDETGTKARLGKTKKILPLVPLLMIKEFWWGDGEPPKHLDFTLSGATKEIERKFGQGSRWVIEVSLKREYAKGEELEIQYIRQLRDSFKDETEWVETVISTETQSLMLSVVFPHARGFKSAKAVRRMGDRSIEYPLNKITGNGGSLNSELTEDGRARISWSIEKPIQGGVYTIEWYW